MKKDFVVQLVFTLALILTTAVWSFAEGVILNDNFTSLSNWTTGTNSDLSGSAAPQVHVDTANGCVDWDQNYDYIESKGTYSGEFCIQFNVLRTAGSVQNWDFLIELVGSPEKSAMVRMVYGISYPYYQIGFGAAPSTTGGGSTAAGGNIHNNAENLQASEDSPGQPYSGTGVFYYNNGQIKFEFTGQGVDKIETPWVTTTALTEPSAIRIWGMGSGAETLRCINWLKIYDSIDPSFASEYYVPYAPSDSDYMMGWGLSNLANGSATNVSIDYYTNAGNLVGTDTFEIPANSHTSAMRDVSMGQSGWAKVTADQPIYGMGLVFGYGEVPMFDLDLKEGTSSNLAVAHVDTASGWTSTAMLSNPNASAATVTLTFHATNGGGTQAATISIPAMGAVQYDLSAIASGAGTVAISSTQGIVGFLLYDGLVTGYNWLGGLSIVPAN